MTTKYKVSVLGHEFTRTTKSRKYTHHIAGVKSLKADRIECERGARASFKMNREYWEKMAAGGTYHSTFANGAPWSKEITADEQTRAIANLDGGVEGYVARALSVFDSGRNPSTMINDDEYLVDCAWAGRPDLAQKAAAQHAKWTIRQIITPAVEVTK